MSESDSPTDPAELVFGRREDAATPRPDSLIAHLQRQRAYGNMVTPRQRQAAERRRRQQQASEDFRLDWDNPTSWVTPDGTYEIRLLRDAHLWHTVNWIVRNMVELYEHYATQKPDHVAAGVAACVWLRDRVTFRAIVKEAVRRDFTFPPDVFRYLKTYVVDRSGSIDGYEPWRDPLAADQAQQLKPFEHQSLLPPEAEYGKDLRAIRL